MREGKLQRLVLAAVELPVVDTFNAVDRHACLLPYISRLLQPAAKIAERHIPIMRKPDRRRFLRIRCNGIFRILFFTFVCHCHRLLLRLRCGLGACKRRIVDRISEVKFLRIREFLCAQQPLLDQQVEVHEIRVPREGGKCLVR